MNVVGIDVSKGKSTVAVIQPFGVVIAEPFYVSHTDSDLNALTAFIRSLPGETKVVMKYTGTYYEPIANALHNNGIFVSVVNPLLIDDYSTNRVRKVKTDKINALRIASYALDKWMELREYIPANDIRRTLKVMNRQYIQFSKILVMQKNNLINTSLDCFKRSFYCGLFVIIIFAVSIISDFIPKINYFFDFAIQFMIFTDSMQQKFIFHIASDSGN